MKLLSILVPFLNEERTIWKLLERIIYLNLSSVWYDKEIILINDWSNDNSIVIINEIIELLTIKINIKIINFKENHWKWFAIKEWIKKATWDLMVIQDADLEYNPDDLIKIIQKIEVEELDFVYWSRNRWFLENGFKYSYISFLLWWLFLSFLTSILVFKVVTDEPTCYKMYRNKLKEYLVLPEENWFEWEPASTMLLFRKWFKYWETSIHYFPRKQSDGKKINWIDWVKAIKTLFKWRFKKVK